MKPLKSNQLASIEDGVHRQLKRLEAASAADGSLKPLYDDLRLVWGALFQEVRARGEKEAVQAGGDELLCTVFSPRPDGGITETQICRRIVRNRYRQGPDARWFTDVVREVVTADDLARQMRYAGMKGVAA